MEADANGKAPLVSKLDALINARASGKASAAPSGKLQYTAKAQRGSDALSKARDMSKAQKGAKEYADQSLLDEERIHTRHTISSKQKALESTDSVKAGKAPPPLKAGKAPPPLPKLQRPPSPPVRSQRKPTPGPAVPLDGASMASAKPKGASAALAKPNVANSIPADAQDALADLANPKVKTSIPAAAEESQDDAQDALADLANQKVKISSQAAAEDSQGSLGRRQPAPWLSLRLPFSGMLAAYEGTVATPGPLSQQQDSTQESASSGMNGTVSAISNVGPIVSSATRPNVSNEVQDIGTTDESFQKLPEIPLLSLGTPLKTAEMTHSKSPSEIPYPLVGKELNFISATANGNSVQGNSMCLDDEDSAIKPGNGGGLSGEGSAIGSRGYPNDSDNGNKDANAHQMLLAFAKTKPVGTMRGKGGKGPGRGAVRSGSPKRLNQRVKDLFAHAALEEQSRKYETEPNVDRQEDELVSETASGDLPVPGALHDAPSEASQSNGRTCKEIFRSIKGNLEQNRATTKVQEQLLEDAQGSPKSLKRLRSQGKPLPNLPEKRLALLRRVFTSLNATDVEIGEAMELLAMWIPSFDPLNAAAALEVLVAQRNTHKDPRFSELLAQLIAVLELNAEEITRGLSLEFGTRLELCAGTRETFTSVDNFCNFRNFHASRLHSPELAAKVLHSLRVANQIPSERLLCYLAYCAVKGAGILSRTEIINTASAVWAFRGCSEGIMAGVCFRSVEQIGLLSVQHRSQLAYNLDVMNAQGILHEGIAGAAFHRIAADIVSAAVNLTNTGWVGLAWFVAILRCSDEKLVTTVGQMILGRVQEFANAELVAFVQAFAYLNHVTIQVVVATLSALVAECRSRLRGFSLAELADAAEALKPWPRARAAEVPCVTLLRQAVAAIAAENTQAFSPKELAQVLSSLVGFCNKEVLVSLADLAAAKIPEMAVEDALRCATAVENGLSSSTLATALLCKAEEWMAVCKEIDNDESILGRQVLSIGRAARVVAACHSQGDPRAPFLFDIAPKRVEDIMMYHTKMFGASEVVSLAFVLAHKLLCSAKSSDRLSLEAVISEAGRKIQDMGPKDITRLAQVLAQKSVNNVVVLDGLVKEALHEAEAFTANEATELVLALAECRCKDAALGSALGQTLQARTRGFAEVSPALAAELTAALSVLSPISQSLASALARRLVLGHVGSGWEIPLRLWVQCIEALHPHSVALPEWLQITTAYDMIVFRPIVSPLMAIAGRSTPIIPLQEAFESFWKLPQSEQLSNLDVASSAKALEAIGVTTAPLDESWVLEAQEMVGGSISNACTSTEGVLVINYDFQASVVGPGGATRIVCVPNSQEVFQASSGLVWPKEGGPLRPWLAPFKEPCHELLALSDITQQLLTASLAQTVQQWRWAQADVATGLLLFSENGFPCKMSELRSLDTSQVTGNVHIYSTCAPSLSCIAGLAQFVRQLPKVVVAVAFGRPSLPKAINSQEIINGVGAVNHVSLGLSTTPLSIPMRAVQPDEVRRIHSAIRWDTVHPDELQMLMPDRDAIECRDFQNGNAPLHIATLNGHMGTVSWLLRSRCDVDAQNHQGNTALHLAVTADLWSVAKKLVEHGASRKMPNLAGHTAITGIDGKKMLELGL